MLTWKAVSTTIMSNRKPPFSRGFTIIEVMIVLAIAGLILLMVFLSVPALGRNARNAERKNDLGKFVAAVEEYRVNSGLGVKAPFSDHDDAIAQAEFNNFKQHYLGSAYQRYTLTKVAGDSTSHATMPDEDQIIYFPLHFCNHGTAPATDTVDSGSTHSLYTYAVLIGLEPNTYYCLDNGKD
jgi:prepilin-type N-terminal cleavage/methylation domain-containing protein